MPGGQLSKLSLIFSDVCGLGLKRRVIRPKSILDPANRGWLTTLDCHDVESHDVICVVTVACVEKGGRADYFLLLVAIHGMAGLCKAGGGSESDFHEDEALVVEHDQVNLAAATAEVSGNRTQALLNKIAKCRAFSAVA